MSCALATSPDVQDCTTEDLLAFIRDGVRLAESHQQLETLSCHLVSKDVLRHFKVQLEKLGHAAQQHQALTQSACEAVCEFAINFVWLDPSTREAATSDRCIPFPVQLQDHHFAAYKAAAALGLVRHSTPEFWSTLSIDLKTTKTMRDCATPREWRRMLSRMRSQTHHKMLIQVCREGGSGASAETLDAPATLVSLFNELFALYTAASKSLPLLADLVLSTRDSEAAYRSLLLAKLRVLMNLCDSLITRKQATSEAEFLKGRILHIACGMHKVRSSVRFKRLLHDVGDEPFRRLFDESDKDA